MSRASRRDARWRQRAALHRVLMAVLLLPWPTVAQAQSVAVTDAALPASVTGAPRAAAADSASTTARTTATATTAHTSDEARELIRNGDNDRAIEVLRAAIARNADRPAELREAYLLLIKTYVFLGNDFKFRPQGREASNLNYRAARELIAEALAIPALRGLRPEPANDYPPEMVTFFAEARSQMFGGFRVIGTEPPAAVVLFDGSVLAPAPGQTERLLTDLPVGPHPVTVRAHGYKDLNETIAISPSATLERSYRLEKRRGAMWYATRLTGVAAIVAGTVALVAGSRGSDTTPTATPLPGAPPPPTQ